MTPAYRTKKSSFADRLNSVLSQPVWLFGGVAVDFLVGRWTRPHGDIDINATLPITGSLHVS